MRTPSSSLRQRRRQNRERKNSAAWLDCCNDKHNGIVIGVKTRERSSLAVELIFTKLGLMTATTLRQLFQVTETVIVINEISNKAIAFPSQNNLLSTHTHTHAREMDNKLSLIDDKWMISADCHSVTVTETMTDRCSISIHFFSNSILFFFAVLAQFNQVERFAIRQKSIRLAIRSNRCACFGVSTNFTCFSNSKYLIFLIVSSLMME